MFGWLMPTRWARGLSEAFATQLGEAAALPPGDIVGLEHEYVLRRAGSQVDFRALIEPLVDSPAGLQPADPYARWLPSGAIVTADGQEAEVALPPTPTFPGFSHTIASSASAAASWLRGALPGDVSLEGYSTHLSVSVPNSVVDEVASHYARTYAPALMLLLDNRASPGLLVRPRPGRLELGGEYAAGDELRAAAVFALGSALACLTDVKSNSRRVPRLRLRLAYADIRFGWYVDRRALGSDLYTAGRAAPLLTETGNARRMQAHLEQTWSAARAAAAAHADEAELRLIDELVEGQTRLRIERDEPADDPLHAVAPHGEAGTPSAYGRAIRARRRGDFDLAPIMLTWELALFVVADARRRRRAYAAVPGPLLGRFVDLLDAGRLDDIIGHYLRLRSGDRLLPAGARPATAGLYDGYAVRPSLLAPERPLLRPGAQAA